MAETRESLGLIDVELPNAPAALIIRMDDYLEELLRELYLLRLGRASGAATTRLPERLLAAVDEILTNYADARMGSRKQAEDALTAGVDHVTMRLSLPAIAAEVAERFMDLIERLHGFARSGELLTLPPDPGLIAFEREWLTEIVRQLRGLPGSPRQAFTDSERLLAEAQPPRAAPPSEAPTSPPRVLAAPRRTTFTLQARAQAPSEARLRLRLALEDWDAAELADEAALPLSELVTNALLHTDDDVTVEVALEGRTLRIAVGDNSPIPPARLVRGEQASVGRGLLIVEALAARWGVDLRPPGKAVWFELDVDNPADSYRAS